MQLFLAVAKTTARWKLSACHIFTQINPFYVHIFLLNCKLRGFFRELCPSTWPPTATQQLVYIYIYISLALYHSPISINISLALSWLCTLCVLYTHTQRMFAAKQTEWEFQSTNNATKSPSLCIKKAHIAAQQDEYVPLKEGRFTLCVYNTSWKLCTTHCTSIPAAISHSFRAFFSRSLILTR